MNADGRPPVVDEEGVVGRSGVAVNDEAVELFTKGRGGEHEGEGGGRTRTYPLFPTAPRLLTRPCSSSTVASPTAKTDEQTKRRAGRNVVFGDGVEVLALAKVVAEALRVDWNLTPVLDLLLEREHRVGALNTVNDDLSRSVSATRRKRERGRGRTHDLTREQVDEDLEARR